MGQIAFAKRLGLLIRNTPRLTLIAALLATNGGLAWADEGLVTASLDHAMWFHRPGRVDDWLLYAQQALSAGDGRGLATGRFFAADGTHLATVVQEGMIRVQPGGKP